MATKKKTSAKAVETEIVETKAAEQEVVAKEEAPKKAGRKKAADTAATPKKAARTAKKAAQPQASVTIQYAGKDIVAKEVLEAATKAFQEANEGVAIESIQLYIKPEEGVAYYAVNGIGNDDYKVVL